jgi:drug/metabolite transporter (DMT)-like permease
VPVYNLFFFMAMKEVSSGTAALIIATNPVFTALLAAPLLGEPFGKRRAGGLLLGLAGVFVVIRYGAGASLDIHYWRSALILLLAPLSWAGYTLIGKSLPADCNRLDASLAQLVIGSAPLALFITPALGHTLLTHPLALWSSLYLGLLCTLFGFAAWLWALGRLSATQTAAFVFLNPPLANLWAWLLGETRLTPVYLLGAALLLCGVGLIVFGRKN